MKSLSTLTYRYMWTNRKRTITTIVGVFLAAVLIYTIFCMVYSVQHSLDEKKYADTGGYDVSYAVTPDVAEKLRKDYRDSKTVGGLAVPKLWISWNDETDNVIRIDSFDDMAYPTALDKGTYPKKDQEVLAPKEYNEMGQLVERYGEDGNFPVGKIVGLTTDKEYDAPNYALLTDEKLKSAESVLVYIAFEEKSGFEEKLGTVASAYGIDGGEVNELAQELYRDGNRELDFSKAAIDAFILMIVAVFGLILMVIIRNAFNISVNERMKDYGILRCIGLTRKQIIGMIIKEALIVALIGAILGMAVGHLLSIGLFALVNASGILKTILTGTVVSLQAGFYIRAILGTLIVVILATCLSMVSPIQKLFKMNPIETRSQPEKLGKHGRKGGLSEAKVKRYGVAIAYGLHNAKRAKGRFIAGVITLGLGVALVVASGTALRTMKSTELRMANEYDAVAAWTDYEGWKKAWDARKSDPNTDAVYGYTEYTLTDEAKETGFSKDSFQVIGMTDALYQIFAEESQMQDAGDSGKVPVIQVPNLYGSTKWNVGDTFKVKYSDKEFYVAGTMDPELAEKFLTTNYASVWSMSDYYIYKMDADNMPIGEVVPKSMYTVKKESGDREVMDVSLEADILTGIRGRDYEELQKELYDGGAYKVANIGAAFRMVSFLHLGILCVIAFILVLIITNTINVHRSQLHNRRDEFKTLRCIGLSEKQKRTMLLAEGMASSILAVIVGTLLGLCLAFLLAIVVYNGNGITGSYLPEIMHIRFTPDWIAILVTGGAIIFMGWLVAVTTKDEV